MTDVYTSHVMEGLYLLQDPKKTKIFFFWWYHAARGILALQPGIKPEPFQWKLRVLITGPPGKSQESQRRETENKLTISL